MVPVDASNLHPISSHYYLPHHAVFKPDSTTTKVRVVFNASCPSSNGLSLYDMLHTGPVLQNDLTLLILNWRSYRYVFNGDIQKMYRQIRVNSAHTPYQRILFRKNPGDPIQDFELQTVTFGVNSAPYLAIRTILQLANDIQKQFPLASKILRTSMYVDDALVGAHDVPSAIQARDEVIQALKSAGLVMRKWTSNCKDILKDLPPEDLLYSDFLDFEDHSSAKTLGVRWNALLDEFYFKVIHFPEDSIYTKRVVLSHISKLFDPAGWLAPIIILAKIIMQRIWMDKTEWDATISTESLNLWTTFQEHYPLINNIRIPRWINYTPDADVQFHGFCDASERAYAAVLYIRVAYSKEISTYIISSKTKVAPIKTLSIPRLELCGALLLAEMIDNLLPQLDIQNYSVSCWSDSTIVLSWLAKQPCCWNTFVANRVSKIIQITDPSKWFHVESNHNPADLASRGVYPQDLINNTLWWRGPEWLSKPADHWPSDNQYVYEEIDLEKKPIKPTRRQSTSTSTGEVAVLDSQSPKHDQENYKPVQAVHLIQTKMNSKKKYNAMVSSYKFTCRLCRGPHGLKFCTRFRNANTNERLAITILYFMLIRGFRKDLEVPLKDMQKPKPLQETKLQSANRLRQLKSFVENHSRCRQM
ncbi:uncharacterized protein [Musca autumnalis]|uniref:uncharacterized protein n=1 Tax=Musca autumnalis TaxID=221902 RepID=UPI003CE8D104